MKEIDPNLPANKIAALVVSKCADKKVYHPIQNVVSSMTPLPTTQFTGPIEHNLTGYKCGRFTVIGFSLKSQRNFS